MTELEFDNVLKVANELGFENLRKFVFNEASPKFERKTILNVLDLRDYSLFLLEYLNLFGGELEDPQDFQFECLKLTIEANEEILDGDITQVLKEVNELIELTSEELIIKKNHYGEKYTYFQSLAETSDTNYRAYLEDKPFQSEDFSNDAKRALLWEAIFSFSAGLVASFDDPDVIVCLAAINDSNKTYIDFTLNYEV